MEMGSQSHLAPVEEDFINMEITTPYYSNSSPQIQSKDFEFQHLSSASSSASDLFYRGKLLPLHLRRPPPFLSAPCTTSNTPSDSCNISPSQSCRPSCDLIINPTHFTDLSITTFFFNNNNNNNQHPPRNNNDNNNSWSKMKKLNKRSYLAHKLKSSRAFLKSLFFTKQSSNTDDPTSYSRFGKKLATFINKNGIIDHHRRSFSGAIASDSSSSSTSTSTSSSFNEVQFLRSSSSAAEIEVSIDAAIAHCKKSYATN